MCTHHHLPPPDFDALLPHLPARSVNVLISLHSAKVCPKCASLLKDTNPEEPLTPELRMARALGLHATPDRIEALRREVFQLRTLAREERLPAIRRATVRFRSPLLVVVLLTRARGRLRSDPEDALDLATLAAGVAEHGTRDSALTALALAYAGNVHRAAGRLDLANPYFERALKLLPQAPDPPLWLRAELNSLQGSLFMDHRYLKDAEVLLLNAAAMFKATSDQERLVRVRLKLATLFRLYDQPEQALDTVRQTLSAFDPWRFPMLHLALLHSLALYLSEADEPHLARVLVKLAEPLYASYPGFAARRGWLRGLILRALGEVRAAEGHLRQALGTFVDDGSSFLAAFVAVDLADLLLSEGRSEEVVEVTRHLPGLFQSLDVHPEAVAATLLFHKAAAEMQVNEEYVAIFRRFLERAQVDRSVSFVPLSD